MEMLVCWVLHRDTEVNLSSGRIGGWIRPKTSVEVAQGPGGQQMTKMKRGREDGTRIVETRGWMAWIQHWVRRRPTLEGNIRSVMKARCWIPSIVHFPEIIVHSVVTLSSIFPLSPQTFRIVPSMCITKPEVDFAVEVFRSALIQHMERRAK